METSKRKLLRSALSLSTSAQLKQIVMRNDGEDMAIYSVDSNGVKMESFHHTELALIISELGFSSYCTVDVDNCVFLRVF